MKRKLLFAMLCIVGALHCTAKAQTWTSGAEVAAGEYYLYNVGAQRFLNRGHYWKNQIVLDYNGSSVTLALSDGAYTIKFDGETNKYMGTDLYADKKTDNDYYSTWAFETISIDGYSNAYALKSTEKSKNTSNHNKYVVWGGTADVALVWSESIPTNANGYWLLIPKTTRQTYWNGQHDLGSKTNPVDVTHLVTNPDFEINNNSNKNVLEWVGWTGDFVANQGSNNAVAFGAFAERWTGDYVKDAGTNVGDEWHLNNYEFKQTLTLPAGTYKLAVDAFAAQQFKDDQKDVAGVTLYFGDQEANIATGPQKQSYTFYKTLSQEDNIDVGMKTVSTTANWVGLDNVRLYYYGNISSGDSTNLQAMVPTGIPAGTSIKTASENFATSASQANKDALWNAIAHNSNLAGDMAYNTWSTEGDSDGSGMTTPFLQNWIANGSRLTNDTNNGQFYYLLDGLTVGNKYKITTLVRVFNEAGTGLTGANYFVGTDTMDIVTTGTACSGDNSTKGIYGTFSGIGEVDENGELKFGVELAKDSKINWIAMKNASIASAQIVDAATAIASGGRMAANTWYYIDFDAVKYVFAAGSDLSDIVYTTDGTVLLDNESSVTTHFSATQTLSAGRYYVKSSSEQTLTFAEASYTVGSATSSISNGDYLKTLTTLVLTYADATTNDGEVSLALIGSPTASLKKGGSEVATGTLTADIEAKTLTATFSNVDLVLNATDYSIVVPAGAFGYEGKSTNAEVTVTFNTPIFADGDYYLKNKGTDAYFTGGNVWGTQAITNTIGRKVNLTALRDGKYTVNTYLFNGGVNSKNHFLNGLWCDGAETGWQFVTSDGSYYQINDGTNNLTAGAVGETMTLASGAGDAALWSLVSATAWKTEQVARLDAASAENGVDATFYMHAPNFGRNDDNENAQWKGSPSINGLAGEGITSNFNAEKFDTTPFDVYQELTGLKPGKYKVTMQGFYRNGTTDDRNAMLYANDYTVELVNIRSANVEAQDDDKGFTTANGNYYVPNYQDQAAKAFNNGYYNNELDFVVGLDGALRIGVKKTTGAANDWAVLDNFQLTYYGAPVVDYSALQAAYDALEIPALGFESGEYAPYENTDNLQAIAEAKNLLDNRGALLQSVIDAAKTAITGLTWKANTEQMNAFYDGDFSECTEDDESPLDYTPKGWTPSGNMRVMLKDTAKYPGLSDASATSALMTWTGGVTYGEQVGYEMPLQANTTYRLSMKVAGWNNESRGGITVSILNGSDGLSATNLGTPNRDIKGNESNTAGMTSYEKVFTTGAAGDYIFRIKSTHSFVLTDLDLRKATATVLDETSTDYTPVAGPANVTLNRTFSATYNTVVLPFSMTTAQVEDVFGDGAVVYAYSEESADATNATVYFNSKAENTIEANVPVLVKATKASTVNTLNGVTISAAGVDDVEGSNFDFVGTFTNGTALQAGDYFIGVKDGVGYLYCSNGVGNTMKGFRAYIKPHADADVKNLWLNIEDDIETRIAVVDGEIAEPGDELIYNLAGQRVQKTTKGLYIVNGKKMIVK